MLGRRAVSGLRSKKALSSAFTVSTSGGVVDTVIKTVGEFEVG